MKKCVKCGAENNDESRFCKACGAELTEAPVAELNEQKELSSYSFRPVPDEEIRALVNRKTPLAEKVLTSVLAFAVVVGLTVMVCDVRGDQKKSDQLEIICSDDKAVFIYNGERLDGSVKDVSYVVPSADETAAYIITNDDDLYCASEKGVKKVSKNAEGAEISSNGRYIFYTGEEQEGYIYNVKKDKSEKIASDADADTAVFSPDGETLVFNKLGGGMYLYDGGDCEKIDSGVSCAAVSDGARRLYAVSYAVEPEAPEKPQASDYDEYDDYKAAYDEYDRLYEKYQEALEEYNSFISGGEVSLYYYPSANADKRAELTDALLYGAEFNSDISQVVFRETDGRTYFCEKDGEPEKISKESLCPVSYNDISWYCGTNGNEVIGRDNLLNMNYRGEDSLWYVDRKGEADKIGRDIASYTSICLSESENKLCYVNEDAKLVLTDAKTGESDKIAKDVNTFIPEKDLGAFYVLDKDGKLYYIKKNGDKEKIDRDVYTVCAAPSGGVYYITDDQDLYFAEKEKSEKIDGSGNVMKIESGERFAMYCVKDGKKDKYATYVSAKGDEDFDEIFKDFVPWDYVHYAD